MIYPLSTAIGSVEAPPIAEAMGWAPAVADGPPLINLCQAVPSYPPAAELQEAIAAAARDPDTSVYAPILGLPSLKDALARHMAEDYRGRIEAGQIAITAGCNQAFCVALMALARPGDNVVMPSPWYFNHDMWLRMLGVEVRAIPAISPDGGGPSPAAAAALIDGRTRAVILCSPNNPTGEIYTAERIGAFFDLCAERGVALILDETYKDFRADPAPPHDLFARARWDETLVQLYSFSKAYALTGYRAGSIIASRRFMAEAEKIMDCVAICAPHIAQRAALFGLTRLADWKTAKTRMMAERVAAIRAAFATSNSRFGLVSSGAYFAYVRHPFAGAPAKTVAQALARDRRLLCLPGSMFGPGQEDYLRLAFANIDASLMAEAVARLDIDEADLSRRSSG